MSVFVRKPAMKSETAATIEPTNAFWRSMEESVLQLEFAGWRFGYRFDRGSIVVVYAGPIDERRTA